MSLAALHSSFICVTLLASADSSGGGEFAVFPWHDIGIAAMLATACWLLYVGRVVSGAHCKSLTDRADAERDRAITERDARKAENDQLLEDNTALRQRFDKCLDLLQVLASAAQAQREQRTRGRS